MAVQSFNTPNMVLPPKRRKIRKWLVLLNAKHYVDTTFPIRTSVDQNFYVYTTPTSPFSPVTAGNFDAYWKITHISNSWEDTKRYFETQAETVPVEYLRLVAYVDLIIDFQPRS